MFKWNIYTKLLVMFISISLINWVLITIFKDFGVNVNIYTPFLVWICALAVFTVIIPNRNNFLDINMPFKSTNNRKVNNIQTN